MRGPVRHALAAFLFALSSCGGAPAVKERGLTAEEADRLAAVLFTNHESKGATFQLVTTFTTTGDTLSMTGDVDWVKHQGHATISARGSEAGVTEVFWNESVIVERRPQLDAMLEATGHPGARYVVRPPETARRQLDRAVAVLTGLASTVRDNGILTLQKSGSAFMRTDVLRGKEVEVMRYGTQNRFWLDKGTSTLRRFDGNAAAGSAPIIIDFMSFGARTVVPPSQSSAVPVDAIRELYAGVSGG